MTKQIYCIRFDKCRNFKNHKITYIIFDKCGTTIKQICFNGL